MDSSLTLRSKLLRMAAILAFGGAAWAGLLSSMCALKEPGCGICGSVDLFLRHNETRLILMGENPYRLSIEGKAKTRAAELLGPGMDVEPDYFPSTLLPVLCMAWLPFSVVQTVWLLLSLASIVLLVMMVRWMMHSWLPARDTQMLLIGLWASGLPVWSCLMMGQAGLFSMALTLAAFRADFQRRWLLAGVLLAFGVFKYAVVWPFVLFFFILQGRWRCLLVGGGIHAVLHLALCHIMQAHPVRIFAEVLGSNGKVFQASRTITVWTPFRFWNARFPDLAVPVQTCGTLLLVTVLGVLAWLWLQRPKHSREGLATWAGALALLAVMTVASRPHAHMYALPLLLMAAAQGPLPFHLPLFQRLRLGCCCLYLNGAFSGADPMGLPPAAMQALVCIYNGVMLLLAFDVVHLLFKMRCPATPRPPS